MVWQWRYEDAAGQVVGERDDTDPAERFPSQADAESWLGENWRTLLESGVHQVTLLENDAEVYGPMGLDAG